MTTDQTPHPHKALNDQMMERIAERRRILVRCELANRHADRAREGRAGNELRTANLDFQQAMRDFDANNRELARLWRASNRRPIPIGAIDEETLKKGWGPEMDR